MIKEETITFAELNRLKQTLDSLGLALANHHHTWSNFERSSYDSSLKIIDKWTEIRAQQVREASNEN